MIRAVAVAAPARAVGPSTGTCRHGTDQGLERRPGSADPSRSRSMIHDRKSSNHESEGVDGRDGSPFHTQSLDCDRTCGYLSGLWRAKGNTITLFSRSRFPRDPGGPEADPGSPGDPGSGSPLGQRAGLSAGDVVGREHCRQASMPEPTPTVATLAARQGQYDRSFSSWGYRLPPDRLCRCESDCRGTWLPEEPRAYLKIDACSWRPPTGHRISEDLARPRRRGRTGRLSHAHTVVGKARPAGHSRWEQDRQHAADSAGGEHTGKTDGGGVPTCRPPGRSHHARKGGRPIRPGTALHHVPRSTCL
ncbi:hypothetical protein FDG2_5992 [Candidatus Protofrankia californiensis]|uniref:Uncharacterized protein n=1 Tax=Candidatus Protofrankia californiensis TaxID=1839754 RepID=A0A1C3PGM3_9ACTN|nr:hypothetical protein FDG2_5992 [Candidatus Protofrankia californiensis]